MLSENKTIIEFENNEKAKLIKNIRALFLYNIIIIQSDHLNHVYFFLKLA